ncbi:hypothetical protein [Yoonia sp. SS1-5]|uniref:Uncharacterized protein n=2 Tax=Yoonia rhodophyticola TaxID=3137370 RepID=A0AAN0NLD9_9RHOB
MASPNGARTAVLDGDPSRIAAIAGIISAIWLVLVGLFLWLMPAPAPETGFTAAGIVGTGIAICMPLALIWLAAIMARNMQQSRAEILHLQTSIAELRKTLAQRPPAAATQMQPAAPPTEEPRPFASRREVSRLIVPQPAPQSHSAQQSLPLGGAPTATEQQLDRVDLIRALNFPDDEGDTAGFAALRRALKDRNARKLVQASQDVLTLLSQDGIYMDDLLPDAPNPALWRRFAGGERGATIAPLGAIRDRDALALSAARMREDTIFRDSVHHFLRKFDLMLAGFADGASDDALLAMAETRTARAFMLLGRATGTFD